MHVENAARLYLLIEKKGKAGDVFNATSFMDVTARQLWEAMIVILVSKVTHIDAFEEMQRKSWVPFAKLLWGFLLGENRSSSQKTRIVLG